MKSRIIALLSCVTLLLATATTFADNFNPKIYQVFVDDDGLMTILGTGFPEGGYVQTLKVGGIPATDIVYDGVADSVQAQVPAQLGPGDYRLLVNFKLNNNAKNVTWDLSIGPQGPQGEQGEQGKLGEAGDQGVQGKLGPPGEDGPQGEQGKLGPQGVQGKMGLPGLGEQGEQGKLGPQGEQGKIGPQGQDGAGCSLGECSDAGEATLTCGAISVVTPCTIDLQILAINDFHGSIATSSGSFGGTGRADFLGANIQAAEAGAVNSIFVSAGDLIGASPLISALFHDEPTIEAMNLIGLDINAVGDHEFDEGPGELLRMQTGGAHPVDGDLDGDPFLGADFEFLAANVISDLTGDTLFPPYTVRNYQGVNVAFIGMTLEGTPTIVSPDGVAGLTFNDEVETVNALVPMLQQINIEAIVVLLHEGGFSDGGQNDCGSGLVGPIAEIVPLLDDAVDLVIAGHTNDEFVCEIDGKWVTMADNRGRLFTDIDVTLNRTTRDMTVVSINNVPNLQAGVIPDPVVTALIDKYDTLSPPLANRVIGTIAGDITRTPNSAGESALGDIVADAQLEATAPAGFGEAVVAFMNPGGIRGDFLFISSPASEGDGNVTLAEAFSVQPFGNSLVTMTLTGAQIDTLLEQQWVGQSSPRILQVSDGFSYAWDANASDGSKVDPASVVIGGAPLNVAASYRVTVNSFLADGGDNFSVLVDGTDRLGGELDLDVLETYFGLNSPVFPGPQDRITRLN